MFRFTVITYVSVILNTENIDLNQKCFRTNIPYLKLDQNGQTDFYTKIIIFE